jgi:hypothetical protein
MSTGRALTHLRPWRAFLLAPLAAPICYFI